MRKSIKTPVQVPAQELEIPVHMLVGEDLDSGWSSGPRRRCATEYDVIETRASNSNPSWVWLLVGLLALALVGLLFWFAFSGVKETVTNSAAATQALVTSTGNGINTHTDTAANLINGNTDAMGRSLLAQENANTSAVRADIAAVKTDVANEGTRIRRSIWSANAATAKSIAANKADLTGLAKTTDLNGLATKGDVDAAGTKLQDWMAKNGAKVTVTPANAAPAASAPAAAPAPAPAPTGAPVK